MCVTRRIDTRLEKGIVSGLHCLQILFSVPAIWRSSPLLAWTLPTKTKCVIHLQAAAGGNPPDEAIPSYADGVAQILQSRAVNTEDSREENTSLVAAVVFFKRSMDGLLLCTAP